MIKIEKPIVLTQTQTFGFAQLRVEPSGGGMMAALHFNVFGDDGELIEQRVKTFEGAAFDEFWAGFNSGKFLFESFLADVDPDVAVPDEVEAEFAGEKIEPTSAE